MHCFTCVVVLLASCVAVIMTNPLPVAQSSPEVSTEGSGQKQMAASIMALYRHAMNSLPGNSYKALFIRDNVIQSVLLKYIGLMSKITEVASGLGADSIKKSAMKSLGTAVMTEACEWLQATLNLTDVNCSQHGQIIIETVGLWMTANDVFSFLGEVDSDNKKAVKHCEWIACNINPQCGGIGTQKEFEFIRDQFTSNEASKMNDCSNC